MFCLEIAPGGIPSIKLDRTLPWVNVMPRPCMETLTATDHMTQLDHFPIEWDFWRGHVSDVTTQAQGKNCHGPYWMLLLHPGLQFLAQEMVGIKRRIYNEMFRDADPWSARDYERRVVQSMEPFLIYPQLEKSE